MVQSLAARWTCLGMAVALAAIGCGSEQGLWTQLERQPTGQSHAVDVDELKEATQAAASALLDAPAIEGAQVETLPDQGGDVFASRWVRQVDGNTFEYVDFRTGGPPNVRGGPTAGARDGGAEQYVRAVVVVDGVASYGVADAPDGPIPWSPNTTSDQAQPRRGPWSFDLPALASGQGIASSLEGQVTATGQDADDGGTTWALTQPGERGVAVVWEVVPAGHLQTLRIDFPGSGPEPVPRRAEIRFRPLETAPEISAPTADEPVDLTRFDVWPDLPRPD